jgi:hypothetical protein
MQDSEFLCNSISFCATRHLCAKPKNRALHINDELHKKSYLPASIS